MAKRDFFNIANIRLSLKALATSIVAGLIWIIPSMLTRYMIKEVMPVLGLIMAIFSFIGYMYTWGFLANKLFNIRD